MRVTQGLNTINQAICDVNKRQYGFLILARARLCYPQTNKVARAFLFSLPVGLTLGKINGLKIKKNQTKQLTPFEGGSYEKNHNE